MPKFTHLTLSTVTAGHSRPKDGVATLAYVPAIHALLWRQGVDARDKRGHDERCILAERTRERQHAAAGNSNRRAKWRKIVIRTATRMA
jgi:hypothetical protein